MESTTLSPDAAHSDHFWALIQRLAQKFEPLQIFSFSKIRSTEVREGCFIGEETLFQCHYCLLLVTELARRDYEIQDFANANYHHGTITVICHGREAVADAVHRNSRFFISVCTLGKLLYTRDGIWIAGCLALFVPTAADTKASEHDAHRMPLAESFLSCALGCMEREQYGIGVFMLHQAVEQTCIALIRVHIAYRSEFHNILRLLRLCRSFSDRPYKLFLSTPEDKKLFDILAKSYSGARYKSGFSVSATDARWLYDKTDSFIVQAKIMNIEKIEFLSQQAEIYRRAQQQEQISEEIVAQI